jgi:hypothetical protein
MWLKFIFFEFLNYYLLNYYASISGGKQVDQMDEKAHVSRELTFRMLFFPFMGNIGLPVQTVLEIQQFFKKFINFFIVKIRCKTN